MPSETEKALGLLRLWEEKGTLLVLRCAHEDTVLLATDCILLSVTERKLELDWTASFPSQASFVHSLGNIAIVLDDVSLNVSGLPDNADPDAMIEHSACVSIVRVGALSCSLRPAYATSAYLRT